MSFREEVGDSQTDHMAEFPFWLSVEIVTIRQVLFRFKVGQILTAVTNVTYASADTGAGGTGATGASAPGTSDADGTGATGTTSPGTSDAGGTGATGASAPGETDGVSGLLTGNTIISSNTDTDGSGTSGATASGITGIESFAGDPHTHTTTGTHTHATLAHFHHYSTPEHNHSETPHAHAHSATHTHTGPSHTHGFATTHTHTGPSHTHAHSATHTHTGPSHTHTAPALVTAYAMQLLPALSTYAIADLEYAINGGAWVSLDTAIPVSGGYSELDITANVQNPAGLKRPNVEYNVVQVRRKTAAGTGKTAQIRAQVGIRCTVQSVVVYS
jgi:hypothetical protein